MLALCSVPGTNYASIVDSCLPITPDFSYCTLLVAHFLGIAYSWKQIRLVVMLIFVSPLLYDNDLPEIVKKLEHCNKYCLKFLPQPV